MATAMILAADRAGAGPALKSRTCGQPALQLLQRVLPGPYRTCIPRRTRWVEEMHAISDFIGGELSPEADHVWAREPPDFTSVSPMISPGDRAPPSGKRCIDAFSRHDETGQSPIRFYIVLPVVAIEMCASG